MRKEISSLGKETLTLKSHETVCARSDEITLQNQRDLGIFYNVISGEQSSHTVRPTKMEILHLILVHMQQLVLPLRIHFHNLWKG